MSKAEKRLDAILAQIREAARGFDEASGANGDGGRKAAKADGLAELAGQAAKTDAEIESKDRKTKVKANLEAQIEALAKAVHDNRGASKAERIGAGGRLSDGMGGRLKSQAGMKAHPALKAAYTNYQAGEFITAYAAAKGYLTDFPDIALMTQGKAKLDQFLMTGDRLPLADLSRAYSMIGLDGKATLGTTGATGGYVLPNNLVDSVKKPKTQRALYRDWVTIVNGVAVRGVDQPYRLSRPARATFADWGATKENVNESYGSYTATLGTLAKIYDVGKQYLRFSAGSAEQDVMDELTKSFDLAENFAIIAGPGTGAATPGVNDPTEGVYTALAASAAFNGYSTSGFTAAAGTLAGSLANGLTLMSAALAARNRESQMWVVDATTFWTAIGQGTDYAGFFVDPTGGPTGFTKTASGGLAFWGVPMFYDSNLGTNAATKIVIGGEWDELKFYRGIEFRIDSSDVAGTRWDQNLVGFRGEEEIGVNALTAVNIGAFQLLTSAIP